MVRIRVSQGATRKLALIIQPGSLVKNTFKPNQQSQPVFFFSWSSPATTT